MTAYPFNFVFDVDGTLTPSRQRIDLLFEKWFLSFCQNNNVYLVSGSDYEKTLEQLGKEICNSVKGVYSCCGNAFYVKGVLQYFNDFDLSIEQETFMHELIQLSAFPSKTGNHLEKRIGLVNLSVVGRNATWEQRQYYVKYDTALSERKNLAELIERRYPDLQATLGGETGIDIHCKGKDKSQIANYIKPFTFFGDKIHPGGNDYTIANKADNYYHVNDWYETFEILRDGVSSNLNRGINDEVLFSSVSL